MRGLYDVSDLGRVRRHQGHELKLDGSTAYGHLKIRLLCNRVRKSHYVHRLVMAAFVGPCPEGKEVAHYNGIAWDNRLSNLRYATPKENHADKHRHGTMLCGEQKSKLSESEALAIISLSADYTLAALAEGFGLTKGGVGTIVRGKTWGHLFTK